MACIGEYNEKSNKTQSEKLTFILQKTIKVLNQ
jgi:hypothetical protein